MNEISRLIIKWYKLKKRDLPWRNTTDPYHIWLSEVILQQTRVVQGLSYYFKFVEKFPTVKKLAEATEDEVLSLWQGLGYYSRARNLHTAAKYVVWELNGQMPSDYNGLLKMKGIGAYTAAAIASAAFHEDQAVVDGNVIRVLARLFEIGEDVRIPSTVAKIKALADKLLPAGNANLFNQGMMELGAILCHPHNPSCDTCPVFAHCQSRKLNKQHLIPFKSKAKEKRKRFLNYLLLEVDGWFYFEKRGPKDIWEGLYEPILFEANHTFDSPDLFLKGLAKILNGAVCEIQVKQFHQTRKHILTHQLLWVTFCHIGINQRPDLELGTWVPAKGLNDLPKPVIISKILNQEPNSQLSLEFK